LSFFDRREVRDLLAYLKVIANPADEASLLRIINTPARGIGESSVEKLLARAVQAGAGLWNVLPHAETDGDIPFKAAESLREFCGFIEFWRQKLAQPPLAAGFRELIDRMDYRSEVARNYREPLDRANRWNTVEELVNALAQYEERSKRPSLEGFLEDIALVGREEENDKEGKLNRNAVVLMTLHSAKGLEFPNVYLVGVEEGLLPHERAVKDGRDGITEERRLAYVGVTRARDRLTLTWTQSRTKWGKRRPTRPSRFLAEMRGEVEPPKPKKKRAAAKRTKRKRSHTKLSVS
jgi:DNA helicase-2/ATP-dependent DNA helicase PcrA